jgi:WhiB family redox-sensing transcriptional regulator
VKTKLPCQTVDPELFFPVGTTGPAQIQAELAKTFCARCPLEVECLTWALEHHIDSGIWGGTTELERRDMVRRGYFKRRNREETAPLMAQLASA